MTNALFGFPRVTPYFTVFGGGWETEYPLTNLLVLPLSKVARSENAQKAFTIINATTAVPQRAGMIALTRHNMTVGSRIRLRVWSESAMTNLVFDSNWENTWPEVYPFAGLEWEDNPYWSGTYSAEDLAGSVWTWYRRFATTSLMVGAIKIEIDDESNIDGYVQAGYLEISNAFETTINFPLGGLNYGFRWRSQVTEAIGGAQYVDRRVKPRVYKGSIPYSPRADSLGKFYEMQRQLDMDLPMIFVPMPDEPLHYLRTVMLCRQRDPGFTTMVAAGRDAVPVELEEIIG